MSASHSPMSSYVGPPWQAPMLEGGHDSGAEKSYFRPLPFVTVSQKQATRACVRRLHCRSGNERHSA